MNMEHEYYILKEKTYHTSPTGKTTGSFGFLQFKNREREERILHEALEENSPFSLMDKVEFAFNLKVGGATLGDYHEHSHYPNIMVFSLRITELLKSMNISTVQYISARIYKHRPKDTFSDDYTILHALKNIDCRDKEKSVEDYTDWSSIILEQKKLEAIPLSERLIFQLDNGYPLLFHKTIAEKINLLDPKGAYFYDLNTWNSKTFYLHGFGPKYANP